MNILDKLGFTPVRWSDNGLVILDQRKLPLSEEYLALNSVDDVARAIGLLAVRGAPLIGIVAAYGLCLLPDPDNDVPFKDACEKLISSRPTAVNLPWAVERMILVRNRHKENPDLKNLMLSEARAIHNEDAMMCEKIGTIGNEIVPHNCQILTHCNAGALATGGIGTALGVIYTAFFYGKSVQVWVDETRPVLQGSRLTAWELSRAKVPYKVIVDNMAGRLMADGKVDLVITGADRIANNLDFANKTGTYALAVLASYHKIPFYCAAPSSTFDPECPGGASIPIEYRNEDEIRILNGSQSTPFGADVYNPGFDITPHSLICGIITEKGIVRPWDHRGL